MSSIHRFSLAGMASLLLLFAPAALAGNVTIPNTFTAHTPAVATQVNANFTAIATAVNGSATDIAALQAAIATMQTAIDTLNNTVANQQTTINSLTNQMAAVQSSSVMELAANLDMIDVPEPSNPAITYRTAQFHGINVQVVNGMYNQNTTNGLGNLIVGYNPVHSYPTEYCSDGQYISQGTCEGAGGTWAANQRGGSHNLVVGSGNAYTQYGGFVGGAGNVVNRQNASVSGGYGNMASNVFSSVSGGEGNTANGYASSVSGGYGNEASGEWSSVSGGAFNTASGNSSSVSGGLSNTASQGASSVSGGYTHDASGDYDWRAGSLFEDQ